MYLYIYIYIHTYTYIYMCICTHIYICIYTYMRTYIYIYTHTHIYTYTYIYIYIYICLYVYVHIRIRMHTHMFYMRVCVKYVFICTGCCMRSPWIGRPLNFEIPAIMESYGMAWYLLSCYVMLNYIVFRILSLLCSFQIIHVVIEIMFKV